MFCAFHAAHALLLWLLSACVWRDVLFFWFFLPVAMAGLSYFHGVTLVVDLHCAENLTMIWRFTSSRDQV